MNGTEALLLDCGLPFGQCDDVRIMQKSMLSVSIICVIFALTCIFLLKKYAFFFERIVCHILVAELFTIITYLSGGGNVKVADTPRCIAQGFFLQLFPLAELVWICILTIYVYIKVVKCRETSQKERLYTLIGWMLPTVISLLPLIGNNYGIDEGPFCWIKGTDTGYVYRIFLYWVPGLVSWLGMVAICSYIAVSARKSIKSFGTFADAFTIEHKQRVQDLLIALAGYSGCFLLLITSVFITRLCEMWLDVTRSSVTFAVMAFSLWGLVLSILFLLLNRKDLFRQRSLGVAKEQLLQLLQCLKNCQLPQSSDALVYEHSTTATPTGTLQRSTVNRNDLEAAVGDNPQPASNEDDNMQPAASVGGQLQPMSIGDDKWRPQPAPTKCGNLNQASENSVDLP